MKDIQQHGVSFELTDTQMQDEKVAEALSQLMLALGKWSKEKKENK